MKFAVGYQQQDEGVPFPALIADFYPHIREVYFPWPGHPSGRPVLGVQGETGEEVIRTLEDDLRELNQAGIKLDLLLNGNCYGGRAISTELEKEVISIIDHLASFSCFPDVVTTASLMIARTVKKYFPSIDVRASVNMRLGTIRAMEYVTGLFDSFYLQRDVHRDLDYVGSVREWCLRHGKKLCILANSGCLRYCPGQVFHDNLIAHNAELEKMENLQEWNPHVCWNLYRDPGKFAEILKSTWIRPEDIAGYEGLVDVVKLATRQHDNPRMVIRAYTEGKFQGNLLDLLEPGFSPAFAPFFIDNTAFPDDWAENTRKCRGDCGTCSYCDQVMKKVLKSFR